MAEPRAPSHERYMREALRLALLSPSPPYPNPWVGCVIERDGKVVGRGFHRGAGTRHAEVEALAQAGRRARGATLYTTLEPCCHYGRTPPCTDAILAAGLARVVYALRDPNPEVAGRGVRALRKHGVELVSGICAAEAARLNEVYLKFRSTGLPFVSLKIASSLDGKIATRTGKSKWITDAAARRRGRELRSANQAVVVGIGTVLADDPHLGPRRSGAPEPWRVVLDSALRIPAGARVVKTGRCIVACAGAASLRDKRRLEDVGVRVWRFAGRRVPLRELLGRMTREGILSALVEGGGEVAGAFFDRRLVDRVFWFVAPIVIGSAESRSAVAGRGAGELREASRLRQMTLEPAGRGVLIRGNVSRWALS
ncbi:MAG: bifunctional diaminohydroxyphosphoribosylaminopyrimidine deaminase/5-amino-6-(5-phosphoribosylamino)uracil reductase RibD [Terriglobia bacterium]